eukprot:GHVP01014663.1.p1 GENE.GHVP01014663.1~~GHVP01014663.1.p1  ORF type:complete len:459 (+),score=79.72 GHVP01014663.1:156-1379(+)
MTIENIPEEKMKHALSLPKESIIDAFGEVKKTRSPVLGCTVKDKELHVFSISVIIKAASLPFTVEEASRKTDNEENLSTVALDTRLNNRTIDLRTSVNLAIFRVKSKIEYAFQSYMFSNGFIKINTPKMISAASEGGANVFKLKYFDREAFLAQSPQLYKQMAICSDFGKVFEVGPVFRAEHSTGHRHLTEYTGLDFEMEIKTHYHELIDVIHSLVVSIFKTVEEGCKEDLDKIREFYPSEKIIYTEKPVLLTFKEGVQLLRDAGHEMEDYDDLNTERERALGAIVREKYNTDFYGLDKYPTAIRPFYAMKDPEEPLYSNTYDFFVRGEEILSGGQRINVYEDLVENAKLNGVDTTKIKGYLDAFKYGAPKHGGIGIGLDRLVMLMLNLGNIRKASMFPRDPTRLYP